MGRIASGYYWALLAALLLLCAGMLAANGGHLDRVTLGELYAGRRPYLAASARVVTELGAQEVRYGVTVIAAALLAWSKRIREAVLAILVPASGSLLVSFQKLAFARPRPPSSLHLTHVSTLAFPSGHTAGATMVCLTIGLLLTSGKRAHWACYAIGAALAIGAMVGLTRVMLGVHWLSDVAAGFAFGCFWTLLWLRLADQTSSRSPSRATSE